MVYWPRDCVIVIRIKFKKGVEVYSLSSVTFVFYRELNSSSFILVRWLGGWVAGLFELITNSAQAEARARAELGKNQHEGKNVHLVQVFSMQSKNCCVYLQQLL